MISARILLVFSAFLLAQASMAGELPLCEPVADNSSESDIAFIKGMSNAARLTKAAEYSQDECKKGGGRSSSIRQEDLAKDEVRILCSTPAKGEEVFAKFSFHTFYIASNGHMNRIFTGDECIPTINYNVEATLWR